YPKPDGTSTFTDYTRFMGEDGAYFDIGKESSNLFELPDLRSLPSKLQQERFEDYKDFLATAILAMVTGNRRDYNGAQSQLITDTVRSILALALKAFFSDDLIRDRYAAAYVNGFGSDEWATMPTLHDFLNFCSHERLRLDSLTGDTKAALETIRLRLRFWLSSRVGQALAQPSTFRSNARLLIFALRNLSNDEDAAILSLSAYSAALRRALAARASIFFIDESPILFEYDSIAALVGRLCANGAKAGIRVILSAQDPDTIAQSPSGAKIFQNLTTRLIGRIQPTAINSFVT
ncbi:type IV secretory system conjugative DNA transfer family protein, partial [Dulcicalothrix desertica]